MGPKEREIKRCSPCTVPRGVNDLLRLRNNMMAGHYSLMTDLLM